MLILNLADSSTGVGALGFSGGAFLVQLITFVLAFLVLKRWAFKPIVRVMKQRREIIERGVHLGEKLEKEKEELDLKVEQLLGEARTKADAIVLEAQEEARQMIHEAEVAARQKVDNIVADAQVKIDLETAQAKAKLEKQIVGLIAEATEAIIEEKIDAKKDANLISQFLKERLGA